MREQPFERFFKVKRSFTDQLGRKHWPGATIQLNDVDEVRRLLGLGFVVPGGKRTMDSVVNIRMGGEQ